MKRRKGRRLKKAAALMLAAVLAGTAPMGAWAEAVESEAAGQEEDIPMPDMAEEVLEPAAAEDTAEAVEIDAAEPEADIFRMEPPAEPEEDAEEDEEILLDVSGETDAPELVLEDASLQALEEGEGEETGGTPEKEFKGLDHEADLGWKVMDNGTLVILNDQGFADWADRCNNAGLKDTDTKKQTGGVYQEVIDMGLPFIKAVEFPENVQKIPANAFKKCTNLGSVTIPESVTTIGNYAFQYTALESVEIPAGVTTLNGAVFGDCTKLSSVTLPEGLEKLSTSFAGCTALTEITLPESLKSIYGTFQRCTNLGSTSGGTVKIPAGVTEISQLAFSGCKRLTSITIPDGVVKMDGPAFRETGLTSVVIPDSVTGTLCGTFFNCTELEEVVISKNVTELKGYRLIASYPPDGVFEGCTKLKNVTIPDSVTILGEEAFKKCESLTSIDIPDSVQGTLSGTFAGCTNLATVTISKNVTALADSDGDNSGDFYKGTFSKCKKLTSVTFKSQTPPDITKESFDMSEVSGGKTGYIYAPAGCYDLYREKWGFVVRLYSELANGVAQLCLHVDGYEGSDPGILGSPVIKRYNLYEGSYVEIDKEYPLTAAVEDGVITYSTGKALNVNSYYKWELDGELLSTDYFQVKNSTSYPAATEDHDYCTVSFRDDGSVFDTQYVKKGGRASRPADPEKGDTWFLGWKTADGSADFAFDTGISKATTVLAQWHQHTAGAWSRDAAKHWRFCSHARCSGVKVDEAAHTFGAWTVVKEATAQTAGERVHRCTACGYEERAELPPVHIHSFGGWQDDGTNHWKECSICGERSEEAAHSIAEQSDDSGHWQACSVCGKGTEKTAHTWDGVWNTDGTDHWKECTECGRTYGRAAHTADVWQDDGTNHWKECSVCGEILEHAAHSITKQSDDSGHWQGCSVCGTGTEKTAHTWDGVWKTGGTDHWKECTECGNAYGRAAHTADVWQDDGTNHWKECSVCGEKSEQAAHTESEWKTDGETHRKECTGCGKIFIQENHAVGTSWTYEEGGSTHWHACICGIRKDEAEHSYAWRSGDGKHWQECTQCGARTAEGAHRNGGWQGSESEHWKVCADCGSRTEEGAHGMDGAWKTDRNTHWKTCTQCGKTVGKEAHEERQAWSYTEGGSTHWHDCICGLKKDEAEHSYEWHIEDGTHRQVCTDCGAQTAAEAHSYDTWASDGTGHWLVCGACGKTGEKTAHTGDGVWKTDRENHWQMCTDCGARLSQEAHEKGGWETDGTHHWKTCGVCEAELVKSTHSYGHRLEHDVSSHWRVCTVCERAAEPEAHSYDEGRWVSDGESHWHECACGERTDLAAHSVGGSFESDENGHWKECTGCGALVEGAAHEYGDWKVTREPAADTAGLRERECRDCGYKTEEVLEKLHTHSYGVWMGDASAHWRECGCGHKSGLDAHRYGEWKTTKKATVWQEGKKTRACSVCGWRETVTSAKLAPFIELNVQNGETVPMKVKQKSGFLKVTGMAAGDSIASWTSGSPKIVVVDAKTGRITAKKKGTATVTVTLKSGVSASVKIKVQKGTVKTKSVNVTVGGVKTKKLNLMKKEKAALETLLKPLTTQQKVTYKSSNKKVATVSKKGVVTAKKKGKAKITVKSGSKKFVITVYVK